MKLKYKMTFTEVAGYQMAVPIEGGDDFRGILRMNETTADILKTLENDVTEDEIVAFLAKDYDATEEDIRDRVQKAIAILKENNLLID